MLCGFSMVFRASPSPPSQSFEPNQPTGGGDAETPAGVVLCVSVVSCCGVKGSQVINGVRVSLPSAAPGWRPDVAVFKERLRILTVGGTRINGVSVL